MAKSQIIKDIAHSKIDVQTALKRTKILLQDLQDEDLLKWITYEIEGYPTDVEVPAYRIIDGQLKGSFFKGSIASHIIHNDVSLPLGNMPDDMKNDILTLNMSHGISALQAVIEDSKRHEQSGLMKPLPAEYHKIIALANNDQYMNITSAYVLLNMPKILNIFAIVESKVLDILCYLEKEFGNLDDLDIDVSSKNEEELDRIKRNIYVFIYNDQSIEIGDNNKLRDSNVISALECQK